MTSLSKLLKKTFVRSYLQQGAELLALHQHEASLLLFQNQEGAPVLVCAAPRDIPPPAAPPQDFLRIPLHSPDPADAETDFGELAAGPVPAPDSPDADAFRKTFAFIARQLQDTLHREFVRRSLGAEALEQYRDISLMQRAVVNLNSSMKLLEVIRSLVEECSAASVPADYALVVRTDGQVEYAGRLSGSAASCQDSPPERSLLHLSKSEIVRKALRGGKSEIFNDLTEDPAWQEASPGVSSLLLAPLHGSRFDLGALVLVGLDPSRPFTSAHLKKIDTLTNVAGIATANAHHFEQVQQILMALVKAMATAIDARDRLTAGHSQRVAQYALGLAIALNNDTEFFPRLTFREEELQEIFYAGLLHDVGKIGVREEVLTKETRLPRPHLELIGLRLALWGEMHKQPWKDIHARLEVINKAYDLAEEDAGMVTELARKTLHISGNVIQILSQEEALRLLTPRGNLTPREWEEIKRHPEESYRILKNIPFTSHFPNILDMVLQHHERLDGSGYPHGVKDKDIILQSRIMAIVDIYDALRQDRHYKKALARDMALTILRQEAKRNKLDSRLVEVFCRDIDDIETTLGVQMDFLPGREFLQ